METANRSNRVLLGIIFLVLGGVLLLRFLGVFPFHLPYYFFSWKTILIILGLIFLATERSKTTGLILFTIGSVFLLRDIMGVEFRTLMQFLIPIALLIIGLVILMPKKHTKKFRYYHREVTSEKITGGLEEVNIFAGGSKFINSDDFRGGEITCIFGGSELNFRNAILNPKGAVLDITCIFGGCTLFVPEDWTVVIETTNVFAGFTDSRLKSNYNRATDPNKVLVIKGVCIFGGGEIKFV
jgi:predicted membrane protein